MQSVVAEMSLEIRSGVEIGRVELYDGEVAGIAAFVASELCALASPGQIVASGHFVDVAGASSAASSLGRSVLRTTDKETELFAL
jgi:class 3 adenylate cyclase